MRVDVVDVLGTPARVAQRGVDRRPCDVPGRVGAGGVMGVGGGARARDQRPGDGASRTGVIRPLQDHDGRALAHDDPGPVRREGAAEAGGVAVPQRCRAGAGEAGHGDREHDRLGGAA